MLDTLTNEMSNVGTSNVETSLSEGSPERDDAVSSNVVLTTFVFSFEA